MQKLFATLFLVLFSFFYLSIHAKEILTVNIISRKLKNGAGKEIDVKILKEELERLGHRVKLFDYEKVSKITEADINIFLAQFKSNWLSKAKLNWFVPNAERCDATLKDLKRFDLILCKTKEALRIFKPISREAYYIGFTSVDRYDPSISKDFSKHLHVAGQSDTKGTEEVINIWKNYPGLPAITIIRHESLGPRLPENVTLITERIPTRSLITLQNESGIHLCPSKTEGFGHSIMEGLSIGAVVITTDAPPMNELVQDKRCLVKYRSQGKMKYGKTYTVDEQDLAYAVMALQQLPLEELQKIGQRNREEYLRKTAEFRQNFEILMNRTLKNLFIDI